MRFSTLTRAAVAALDDVASSRLARMVPGGASRHGPTGAAAPGWARSRRTITRSPPAPGLGSGPARPPVRQSGADHRSSPPAARRPGGPAGFRPKRPQKPASPPRTAGWRSQPVHHLPALASPIAAHQQPMSDPAGIVALVMARLPALGQGGHGLVPFPYCRSSVTPLRRRAAPSFIAAEIVDRSCEED